MAIVFREASTILCEARVLAIWVKEELQKLEDVVVKLVFFLDGDVLVTTLRPTSVRLPKKLQARNLRHLWRREAAHWLG